MDESSLVKAAQAGDAGAFELLVKLHFRGIYQVGFRFMGDHGGADEVVQETFVKAHRSLPGFRGESSFKSWVYRIAINTAKNALRARGARETVNPNDILLPFKEAGFSRLESAQTSGLLRRLVELLPPKQRQTLELRVYEDLSLKEIADILECPFDTAKANFRHAVMNLKKLLAHAESGDLKDLELAWEDGDREV